MIGVTQVVVTAESELNLVLRARGGDTSAFEEIVRAHSAATYRIVAGHLGPDDAEDATQEAFIRVHQGLGSFKGKAQLRTWIYRIATNVALKRLRSRGRRRKRIGPLGDRDPATVSDPSQALTTDERKQALHAALAQLPEHQRAVVVLRSFEGLSFAEVARVLGIERATAESRMARARTTLRVLLQPCLDSEA